MKLVYLIFVLALIGCSEDKISFFSKNKTVELFDDTSKYLYGNDIFDFDKVEHYQIESENENKTFSKDKFKDSIYIKFLYDLCYEDTNTFILQYAYKLKEIGYQKKEFKNINNKELKEILRYKKIEGDYTTQTCIPVYRDILVLKKEAKTIGVIKLCFQCEMSCINGNLIEFSNFGTYHDFQKLRKILNIQRKK